MVYATGLGSWPGKDIDAVFRVVAGELTAAPEGVEPIPYLPELPARGPGAELVGRTAGLLVDLPVDLQPQGWRLVDRPGRDASRTRSLWRRDLDALAEVLSGWSGRFKVQVAGPWTLASELWLPRGERVLDDEGATRDLVESLAEGVAQHVADLVRLLPDAQLVVQVDEPSLPAVALGRVRSASRLRTFSPVETPTLQGALEQVLAGAGEHETVLHCCARRPPMAVLRSVGAGAVSVDVTRLGPRGWESVAAMVESGGRLWAGLLPPGEGEGTDGGDGAPYRQRTDDLVRSWREVGLPSASLYDVTLTPACGLAGTTDQRALDLTRECLTQAARLAEAAA